MAKSQLAALKKKKTQEKTSIVKQSSPKDTKSPQARNGKKSLTTWVSPELIMALKITALKNGLTMQDAVVQSIDDWLRKMGESPVGQ